MQPRKPYAVCLCVCGVSILCLTSGIVLLCLWTVLYDYIISGNLVLKPDSAAYKVWVKNPIPLTFKLFVFNWTNPEDVHNVTAKPKFQELGPYVYTETKEKSNVTWNANDTVTYKHLKKWYFDEARTNASLSDYVTSINPIALSSSYTARNWSYFVKKGLSGTLKLLEIPISKTRTVEEVLFGGYEDQLMTMASKLPGMAGNHMPPMDKFGWFYGRNGSEDYEGVFNVGTGVSGQLGELYNWKYATRTPYYPGECGEFDGASSGEFFPGDLTKESVIRFFSPDLCRYVELEYEQEVTINGIVGYKFSAGDKFLDNGTKVAENKCFCDGNCMPSGALNVSNCRYGSPAFVSLPHFFKADPFYTDVIEGVEPNAETHDFYMIFEPKTAVPLQVAARLQLNLLLHPISGISLYEQVPTSYFPVLWFEQVVTLPDSMSFSLKLLLNFKVICWSIGFILIGIGVLIEICMWYKICATNLFGRKKVKNATKEEVPLGQG